MIMNARVADLWYYASNLDDSGPKYCEDCIFLIKHLNRANVPLQQEGYSMLKHKFTFSCYRDIDYVIKKKIASDGPIQVPSEDTHSIYDVYFSLLCDHTMNICKILQWKNDHNDVFNTDN